MMISLLSHDGRHSHTLALMRMPMTGLETDPSSFTASLLQLQSCRMSADDLSQNTYSGRHEEQAYSEVKLEWLYCVVIMYISRKSTTNKRRDQNQALCNASWYYVPQPSKFASSHLV